MKQLNTAVMFLLLSSSLNAATRPKPVDPFFHDKVNEALVITDFSARMMDAVTTRMALTDSCDCLMERGTYLGTFSMKPLAQNDLRMYSFSIATATATTVAADYIWTKGEHSNNKSHRTIYHLVSRTILAFDIENELRFGVDNSYNLVHGRNNK